MLATEVIALWIDTLTAQIRARVAHLTREEITWRSDPGGNPVYVTVWHFSRWLDFLKVCAFENRPQGEQQWFTRGWAERTGYDPRGLGQFGYGTLTGYTIDEMMQIPELSAAEVIEYLEQVTSVLRGYVLRLDPAALTQPIAGQVASEPDGAGTAPLHPDDQSQTHIEYLTQLLTGSFRHAGEIEALNAIRTRTAASAYDPAGIYR